MTHYTPMAELDALIAMMPPDKPEPAVHRRRTEYERIRLARLHRKHRDARLVAMRRAYWANREARIQAMREYRKAKGAAA